MLAAVAPVSIGDVVDRLDDGQLRRLACAAAGRDPRFFERVLAEISA